MQTDKYTKVILTLIAIGLFLNLAMYLRVTPAGAASNVLEADVVRTKRLEVINRYGTVVVEADDGIYGGYVSVSNSKGTTLATMEAGSSYDNSGDRQGSIFIETVSSEANEEYYKYLQQSQSIKGLWEDRNSFTKEKRRNHYKKWKKSIREMPGVIITGGMVSGNDFSVTNSSGQELIYAGSSKSGNGLLSINNKTGETVVSLDVDNYGNGEVGAWNRKGKGRVWSSQ